MPNSKKTSKEKKVNEKSEAVTEHLLKLLKLYELFCRQNESMVDFNLKTIIKHHAELSKLLVRFTLHQTEDNKELAIKITPLIQAIRKTWYKSITELYLWDLHLPYEELYAMSIFLQQPSYNVEYLEFVDCNVDAYSIECFSRCFTVNHTLKVIIFDYTQIGDEGLLQLCKGLNFTRSVRKLSLCYCNLTRLSGHVLGNLITTTTISELYMDGNKLGCDGFMQLLQVLVERAETHASKSPSQSMLEMPTAVNDITPSDGNAVSDNDASKPRTDDKKQTAKNKKKKKRKKKKEEPVARVGPWLNILHIANNGVDNFNDGTNGCIPLEIMKLMKRWIVSSSDLKEIDLGGNLIGDLAARELWQALKERKEAGLDPIALKMTHRIHGEILKAIFQLSVSSTKRGKKKKKKRVGKRRV